jgi:hypothetical protein
MRRIETISRWPICAVVAIGLLGQLFGCGTLLYPERRGQTSGRIDAGVAILDGIGLLFFLVPGMIAYAIDFSTGSIYLPGGHRSHVPSGGVKVVHVDPARLNDETIREILVREAGVPAGIDLTRAEVFTLSHDEISARLYNAKSTGYSAL